MFSRKVSGFPMFIFAMAIAVSIYAGLSGNRAEAQDEGATTDFRLADCKFKNNGANPYFILDPGYQLVFEGEENGEAIRAVITVLGETEEIDLREEGLRKVKTRVIEEREWVDDELAEVSRNFFARCKETNAVYYFGEEVDIYEDGEIISHDGAWRAGEDGALPGLMMPGTFLLGSRYFQEVAPGVALDQAEHVAMGLALDTPAGSFSDCVDVLETTSLEPGHESVKQYCPGVGLAVDDVLELVDYGRYIVDVDDDGNNNEHDDGGEEEDDD